MTETTERSGVVSGLERAEIVERAADQIEAFMQTLDDIADAPPKLDPVNKTYTCDDGTVIYLTGRKITSLTIERIASEGKPEIPMVEVTIGGKQKSVEYHPHDEGYLAKLAEWSEQSNLRTLRYLFIKGVSNEPTPEFIEEHREWFPNANAADLRYLYIASIVPDSNIDGLSEAIMGYASPTAKGLAEVAASFRSEGERRTD